jgi:hypothetical protein
LYDGNSGVTGTTGFYKDFFSPDKMLTTDGDFTMGTDQSTALFYVKNSSGNKVLRLASDANYTYIQSYQNVNEQSGHGQQLLITDNNTATVTARIDPLNQRFGIGNYFNPFASGPPPA